MADQEVDLLHAGRDAARNDQAEIAAAGERAARSAGHPEDAHAARPRGPDRRQDVRRLPARRERHEEVAAAPERRDPAREDLVEAVIVRRGRQDRRVGAERDGVQLADRSRMRPNVYYAAVEAAPSFDAAGALK